MDTVCFKIELFFAMLFDFISLATEASLHTVQLLSLEKLPKIELREHCINFKWSNREKKKRQSLDSYLMKAELCEKNAPEYICRSWPTFTSRILHASSDLGLVRTNGHSSGIWSPSKLSRSRWNLLCRLFPPRIRLILLSDRDAMLQQSNRCLFRRWMETVHLFLFDILLLFRPWTRAREWMLFSPFASTSQQILVSLRERENQHFSLSAGKKCDTHFRNTCARSSHGRKKCYENSRHFCLNLCGQFSILLEVQVNFFPRWLLGCLAVLARETRSN